jgi:hypothetical protein
MKTAIGIVLACATCLATDNGSAFAGAWEARFQGTIYLVLKVQAGEKLQGTLSIGHISVDKDGDLTEAGPAENEMPIRNASVEEGRLRFDVDTDDEETHVEVRPKGKGVAELVISAPPDIKIKPLVITKRN